MAGWFHDDALDAQLNVVKNNSENLYLCSAQPATFAEANTTYKLGTKATPTFTGPADHTSGRKITVDAISGGTVSATNTATHWALTDDSASKLLATQALSAPQSVTSGNTFSLPAFIISVPDPTV